MRVRVQDELAERALLQASRPTASSSSFASPRVLTIALKLKPELMSLTLPPASVTLVTCSAVVIEPAALSDSAALRPP